jgi:membrane-bound lytic murein transglycosylase B
MMPFVHPVLPPLPLPSWLRWGALLLGLCLASLAAAQGSTSKVRVSSQPTGFAARPEVMAYADALDQSAGWDDRWARRWLTEARPQEAVVRLVTPPPAGSPKNWTAYRARFIEPRRLEAGQRFWQAHADTLARAEQQYGVPAWLVVGIVGVETLYGQHMGQFRVLDALATLAFDFPASHPRAAQRSAFFRDELAALLRLSRQTGKLPTEWQGSYAGAMGLPQFMPSNWQRFGVDFDADGQVDLLNSPADTIGSVARFLQAHGWQTAMPTHFAVQFQPDRLDLPTLLGPDILPTFSAQRMAELGVQLAGNGPQHTRNLALVELQNGDPAQGGAPPSYVAGTENFYAITRYNWSSYYAMAVIELGQEVFSAMPK